MNKSEMYAVTYPVNEMGTKEKLEFFATKQQMEEKIIELSKQLTILNQSYLEFTRVYPLNAAHNTESYEAFQESVKEKQKMNKEIVGGYVVQRILKNGKEKLKTYQFKEDFDYQLAEWKAKGDKEITILSENHSSSGKYYFQREIQKVWGEKEIHLF